MADAAERHFLRATFDDSPDLYDRARPVPPPELFDDLVALTGLQPGARLVEIGCGTGQATLPLAERGFEIVAIELGEKLAALARRKLAPFPRVRIVVSSFEDWEPGGERFDGVVAFNSFHWIDPELRFAKSAQVLRDGGVLAVVGSAFVVHDDADPEWLRLQDDFELEPARHVDSLTDRSAEFTDGGWFRTVTRRNYLWDITFGADEYVAMLGTMSWYRRLDDKVRASLFERIHERVSGLPEQRISPTIAAVLYVAHR